ncbi:MAG: radical SAM/SPASM domain-containing protein [Acidobacteriota bacterium]
MSVLIRPRSLSFNLEPTFRCNLTCEMCPRFSSQDPQLDMSMKTYERIREAMDYAHTVDFTGWGEPMLHPSIYRMVRMARQKGCVTTMTSNGTLLNQRNSLALIDAGMQRLTISVDGLTPQTFEAIRVGASFQKVTENLRRLTKLVETRHGVLELGIAFTLQESNAPELERIVPWMSSVGATVLHLKHLNVISNRTDWAKSFLKYKLEPLTENTDRLRRLEERLFELRREAEESGVRVLTHSELPLRSERRGRHCLATPLESVYFSFQGEMAPCCHFGHHVSRYFDGRDYPPDSLFFGDIRSQDFLEVWNAPDFREFRRGFREETFPQACRSCYLLYGK